MTTPEWLAATAGQSGQANHVNQFLTDHETLYIYAGDFIDGNTTDGAGPVSTAGTWLAQSFHMGADQTTVGSLVMPLRTLTTDPALLPPTSIRVYADDGGAPTGLPLVTVTIPLEFVSGAPLDSTSFTYPLPVSGLTPDTTYWLVTPPAGDATNHYSWYQSDDTSGASTSIDGVTWTPQAYGLQAGLYDQTVIEPIYCTWEDGGQRWTVTEQGSEDGQLGRYSEFTAGQTVSGYLFSQRTFTYTSGVPTGVS